MKATIERPKETRTHTFTVPLTDEERTALDTHKARTGVSHGFFIRRAIRNELARERDEREA